MTAATAIKRQPAGQSTGGQFASHNRAEDTIGLNWPEVPTGDQVARARDEAVRRLAVNSISSRDRHFEQTVEQIAQDIADQEGAYNAWRRGEKHPDDHRFASIWAGNVAGMSKQQVEERLTELEEQESILPTADRATVQAICAYTEDAFEALAVVRAEQRHMLEALRCEGRNLSINQSVVLRERRADQPF